MMITLDFTFYTLEEALIAVNDESFDHSLSFYTSPNLLFFVIWK